MSRNDWRSENSYAFRTSAGDLYGSATRFLDASSNINSGSSVPSMWRCSSAFGMRSTKLLTGTPSPKDTLMDTVAVAPQNGFLGREIQKRPQAAAFGALGAQHFGKMADSAPWPLS